MKDKFGDRIKSRYENKTRIKLPQKTYTILRLDGKAFHTYTKGFTKPFDGKLVKSMDEAAIYLCSKIQGARFAFVQSDEISILTTDFENPNSCKWYDGNILKIASVSASMATTAFNRQMLINLAEDKEDGTQVAKISMPFLREYMMAEFDSRVFTIDKQEDLVKVKGEFIELDQKQETANYFYWRQKDCIKNSVSMVAQTFFSHKELNGKTTKQRKEMLMMKAQPWEGYPEGLQRGRMIVKENYEVNGAKRNRWVAKTAIDIKTHREAFLDMIPTITTEATPITWYRKLKYYLQLFRK